MCSEALRHMSRVPCCDACLAAPLTMNAEFFCSRCRTPFLSSAPLDRDGVCDRCRSGLAGYDSAYSFGYYEGTLRTLIHHFKYAKIEPLGQPLGRLLLRAMPENLEVDMIVPVPLHWLRRLWRGFLSRPGMVEGKRVLLLDDVLTTGATVTTCSALLRQGGALSVTVLTLARVDRRPMVGNAVLTAASAAGGGAK